MYARLDEGRLPHVRPTCSNIGPLLAGWDAPVRLERIILVSLPKMALNGSDYSSPILDILDPTPNGFDEPPIELLEAELPVVDDGQVQLSDLVSRVVQACYAEMTEMAET